MYRAGPKANTLFTSLQHRKHVQSTITVQINTESVLDALNLSYSHRVPEACGVLGLGFSDRNRSTFLPASDDIEQSIIVDVSQPYAIGANSSETFLGRNNGMSLPRGSMGNRCEKQKK